MEKPKFTPGPWLLFLRRHNHCADTIEVQDATGKPVVVWPGFDGTDRAKPVVRANARLVSAAPEMYSALRRALAEAESYHMSCHIDNITASQCDAICNLLPELRAALAKAEGR